MSEATETTLPAFTKVEGEIIDAGARDVEVVEVDTTRDRPDDEVIDALPEGAQVTHLPVRQTVVADPTLGSLIPAQEELKGVAQLAVTLAMAEVVPKSLRENPANVLAVILTGRELGVSPMTAIRTFHVIDGTVTVAPKMRAAMVRQRGLGKLYPHTAPRMEVCPLLRAALVRAERDPDNDLGHDESCVICQGSGTVEKLCPCGSRLPDNDDRQCMWHAERADQPGVVFSSGYTIEMAGAVKVPRWEGDKSNRRKVDGSLLDKENWQNYPERMLSWRALGYLLDDAFPEVGTGIYSPDEMGAVTDEDGQPVLDVQSTEVLVPPSREQRARQDLAAKEADAKARTEMPANPGDIERMKARIERIKLHEGAADRLKLLWIGPDENNPRLVPIGRLRHVDMQTAWRVVEQVEREITDGKFGEVKGDPPEATEQGDAAAGSVDEPAPGEVEPEGQSTAQEPVADLPFDVAALPTDRDEKANLKWLMVAPEGLVDEVAEEIKALGIDDVKSRLAAAELPRTGGEDRLRARLAAQVIRHRMERMAGQ